MKLRNNWQRQIFKFLSGGASNICCLTPKSPLALVLLP